MTGDDDIRALLPNPPPPAPRARETAMAEALARFDDGPAPARKPRPAAAPWWKNLQRPQAGLLAAAALVVAVSLPFALRAPAPLAPDAGEQIHPGATAGAPSAASDVDAAPTGTPPGTLAAGGQPAPDPGQPSARSDELAPPAKKVEMAEAPPTMLPAAPPAPDASAPIVVQGRVASRSLQDTPVAVTVVSSEEYARDEGRDVVVTGTRISKSRPIGRGDWNACTVNDPSQSVSRCRKLADRAAKSVRSEADTYLSDGLKHAWDGDLDQAIASFDAALAIAPELSVAYLNRGLAHDRQGDGEAAIADLDRAVRLSPKSARIYYNRSVLHRKYGDTRRASADEQQAINLDPRYQAILR
jgi:Tfp pilus assembly protein PilF